MVVSLRNDGPVTIMLDSADKERPAQVLEERCELLHIQACLPDNGAQGASVQFLMVRNDDLSEWGVSTQYDMAAALSLGVESDSAENSDALPP